MQTPLQITFKDMDSSPALEEIIRRRAEALDAIYPRLTSCHVFVKVPHRKSETAKVPLSVTVQVDVPGRGLVVGKDEEERREAKEDQTAALNRAFDAVERQLEKLADKQQGEVKASEALPQSGMVKSLFPNEGYGFVEIDNSPELYFTRNAVANGGFDDLKIGMLVHVTIATTEGPMGPQASSIRLQDKSRTPE